MNPPLSAQFTKDISTMPFGRRQFCALMASAAIGNLGACRLSGGSVLANGGRITARPREGVKTTATGHINLGIAPGDRDAILHLPKVQTPVPLLVMLHGATQNADDMFWYLGSTHEEAGVAILAPNSRGTTWDAVGGVSDRMSTS